MIKVRGFLRVSLFRLSYWAVLIEGIIPRSWKESRIPAEEPRDENGRPGARRLEDKKTLPSARKSMIEAPSVYVRGFPTERFVRLGGH